MVSLCTTHLRWYGHVSLATSCVNVPSLRKGRPTKTWSECVMADMRACSLGGIDLQNREAWRFGAGNSSHLPGTPATVKYTRIQIK